MSSLPLGSSAGSGGRFCRGVPEPWTEPSFWATWKSIVQGRRASVSFCVARRRTRPQMPVVLEQGVVFGGVVAEQVEIGVGRSAWKPTVSGMSDLR